MWRTNESGGAVAVPFQASALARSVQHASSNAIQTQRSHEMFPTLLRRMAKEPLKEGLENITRRVPLTIANNTYRARKVWPPDFKGLTPQQQLRFEKKWKRRLGLASHSPKWIKGLKYAQLLTVTSELPPCFLVGLSSRTDHPSCHHLALLLCRVRMVGPNL